MKTLLTLINEYRERPSEALQNIIWNFILDEENGHYFADIYAHNDENDWIEYGDNLRLKKIHTGVFAATEVARNTFGGYFCLLYLVSLSEYNEIQIEEYKDNYPEYKDVFEDDDFYAAACIASVLGVDGAHSSFLAEDDIALEAWVARIEEQYSQSGITE